MMMTLDELAVMLIDCRICPGVAGERCTTHSGRKTRPHANRYRPIAAGWQVGYVDGMSSAIARIRHDCNPDRADLEPRDTLERALAALSESVTFMGRLKP